MTGAFAPRGPAASDLNVLFWGMTIVGGLVATLVVVLLVLARRGRPETTGDDRPDDDRPDDDLGSRRTRVLVLGGGVALPVVVLGVLTVAMLVVGNRLSPRTADTTLEIRVVAHQYWWEVIYPDTGAVTANEVHIPARTPVRLLLEAGDVIHSFWVPQLAGKVDMIPGQVTELVLEADRPGTYLGACAEFCGLQHGRMRFHVVAQERAHFDRWLDAQSAPAGQPSTAEARRGQQTFVEVGCAACHTVRGTEATGTAGPDLTHLASRSTLGAGTVANARGQLGGWIADPQAVKPGNHMPPTPLTGEQLLDLIEYLEGLE